MQFLATLFLSFAAPRGPYQQTAIMAYSYVQPNVLLGGNPVQASWAREFDDDLAYEEMAARLRNVTSLLIRYRPAMPCHNYF